MSVTATVQQTVQSVLDRAKVGEVESALQLIGLGSMLAGKKSSISQAAAVSVALDPPALAISTIRVVAGAAAAGGRKIVDAAGTLDANTCSLSDDGATLTFEANVTDIVVSYIPRPAVPVASTAFPAI